jgi:S-(hydroxymethyl)glutathione dehydrogenase/alcohol dehydrogenase
MKVRAAVARKAGEKLSPETIALDGPREGEVLVEIKATGICHTDEYTLSGADPEGLFPAILGHEGAGVVVDVGKNVSSLKKGDHVIPLYTPECRQCEYCLSRKTNLCVAIRATQGRGVLPDGTSMTDFVNPAEVQGDLVPYLVDLTKGGADYSFECIGNTKVMRQALECAHRGWGKSVIIGVAGAGQEISTRPFQLVTGRTWMGTAFGGARGRTDVPRIVDWYMAGRINIGDLITHALPFEQINNGFDLMRRGESIRSVVVY